MPWRTALASQLAGEFASLGEFFFHFDRLARGQGLKSRTVTVVVIAAERPCDQLLESVFVYW
jgi:hypothetical protein